MSLPQSLIRPRRTNVVSPDLVPAPVAAAAPPPPLTPATMPVVDPAAARPSVVDPSLVPPPFRVQPQLAPSSTSSSAMAQATSAPLDQSLTVRPRVLNPPDALTVDNDYIHQIQTAPLYGTEPGDTHKPSRGRAFLMTALKLLGPSIANSQAEAYATGRTPGWDTLAAGAAGALGGGAVAAYDPLVPLRMQRNQMLQKANAQEAGDLGAQKQSAEVALLHAKAMEPQAHIIAAQIAAKAHADDAQRARLKESEDQLLQMYAKSGYNPNGTDERNKTLRQAEQQLQANGSSLHLVPYDPKKETPPKFNYFNGVWSRVGEDGVPVAVTGKDGNPIVDPTKVGVVEQGLTVAPGTALSARATAAAANATAGRFNVEQANRVEDKTIADERYSDTRYRDDSSKASEFYTKMTKAKAEAEQHAQAAHDLFAQGAAYQSIASGDKQADGTVPSAENQVTAKRAIASLREDAAKELRSQKTALDEANGHADVLRSQYGHIYNVSGEKGSDGNFYPYAEQRPRPPAPTTPSRSISGAPTVRRVGGGGRHYVAPKVSQSQLQGLLQ